MNGSCKKRVRLQARSLWLSALILPAVLPLPAVADPGHLQGTAASVGEQTVTLAMSRYREYAREVCLDVAAGTEISYRLQTPYPLSFDFHHHTDDGTSYLIDHRVESADAGTLAIDDSGHYCFTVRNTLEPPAAFTAHLDYRLL